MVTGPPFPRLSPPFCNMSRRFNAFSIEWDTIQNQNVTSPYYKPWPLNPDDLYGGDFTDGATDGPGTTSASSPLSQSPPSNIHVEIQKNYEELQQKLSLEFHKKLHEWERIKSTANSMTSQSSPMSVGGSRCIGPVPTSSGCGVDDIGYSFHDKSFRRKMEEWERMKNPTTGSSTKHRDSVALHILHEDNLSPHFRKKLHEWQRMKKLLPQEGAPVPPQMKKRLAEWQLWRTGSSKGDIESGHRGVEEHSEDFHKKLQDWERAKFTSASSSPEHAQEQSDGAKTPSPGVVRKNSGGGKSKLGGSGAKTPNKSKSPKEKELHWLEKELHKIEREKHRLEREREKFLEREARLEKMRLAMGSTPKKQEVLIQTSTGFFRFQGISEKFTRRLYEWEKARGIGPEASTFALLTPGYKASLVGHHTAFTGDRDVSDGAILPRCKSASSVSNMITTNISHHQSSLSLNDVGVLEHVGVVAAALEGQSEMSRAAMLLWRGALS
uniref:Uncharacterized protein n=1 Tax=Timema poppense TaxID=170557 RepID=A0A7R9DLH5_TIMPO|nr:unnamed protein product [Timema poppensis]